MAPNIALLDLIPAKHSTPRQHQHQPTILRPPALPLLLGSSVTVVPSDLVPVPRLHPNVGTNLLSRSIASGD
jgi:hypothetical protein